jgi:hypothetical protein
MGAIGFARIPLKQDLRISFRPDWMPSQRSRCCPHVAQSTFGTGPGETLEFSRAILVSSFFEDAAYERMQAAEMA